MKMVLIVTDWERAGKSIYNTEEGFKLSTGDLHSGTYFPVDVAGFPPDIENEIAHAGQNRAYLVVVLRPV